MVLPSVLPLHIPRQVEPLPLANLAMVERGEIERVESVTKELEAERGIEAVAQEIEIPRLRRWCASLIFGTGSIACDVLGVLFILLVIVLPGSVFVGITLCLGLGLMFGFIPALGTISMMTGNALLQASHLPHHTTTSTTSTAGAIGATGSTLLILPLLFIFPHLPVDEDGTTKIPPWPTRVAFHIFLTGLSGPLGAAVLRHDALHAARAGAVGGVLLCPASVALAPYIIKVLREILPYFGDAMKFGCHSISKLSTKIWDARRRYKTTYCSVPATAQDDNISS